MPGKIQYLCTLGKIPWHIVSYWRYGTLNLSVPLWHGGPLTWYRSDMVSLSQGITLMCYPTDMEPIWQGTPLIQYPTDMVYTSDIASLWHGAALACSSDITTYNYYPIDKMYISNAGPLCYGTPLLWYTTYTVSSLARYTPLIEYPSDTAPRCFSTKSTDEICFFISQIRLLPLGNSN